LDAAGVGGDTGPEPNNIAPHCLRAMNPTLITQFEKFAGCCLELAQRAETPASRARLIQMAREYEQASHHLKLVAEAFLFGS